MKQDHLHLRGENFFVSSFSGVISGSPPLTWRKHKLKQLKAKLTGITSTYVEKTNGTKVLTDADKDHLHLRGENPFFRAIEMKALGSPPLTWRKQSEAIADCTSLRITSTYVEKTAIHLPLAIMR